MKYVIEDRTSNLSDDEVERLGEMLATIFYAEPFNLVRNGQRYEEDIPRWNAFAQRFLDAGRVAGKVFTIGDDALVIAFPPGTQLFSDEKQKGKWFQLAASIQARDPQHDKFVKERLVPASDEGYKVAYPGSLKKESWKIGVLGVDKKAQGKGMAKELVEHVFELAKKDNVAVLVEASNPKNVSFYQGLGFTLVHSQPLPTKTDETIYFNYFKKDP